MACPIRSSNAPARHAGSLASRSVGVAAAFAAALLFVAQPATSVPMFDDRPFESVPIAAPFFGITLGLARMLWIYLHDVLPAFDEDD